MTTSLRRIVASRSGISRSRAPRWRPGDNPMIHAALAIALPGDVIVVDGDLKSALMGELMCQQAARIGVAGVVIDGAVRDAEAIRALGLPMYACGRTRTGRRSPPGRINHP